MTAASQTWINCACFEDYFSSAIISYAVPTTKIRRSPYLHSILKGLKLNSRGCNPR
jgi:hypothetical protein